MLGLTGAVAGTVVFGSGQLLTNRAEASTHAARNDEVDSWGCEGLEEQINEFGGRRATELPKYCDEGEIYKKIIFWLYFILGIGAVIMVVYGGYVYMTARGNDAQTKKAKTILLYTVAGLAVAIIATAIVTIVVNLVVDNQLF